MTNGNDQNDNLDLKDILREKAPTYLIPKFNLLHLMSLPNNDFLELKPIFNSDIDLIDESETVNKEYIQKDGSYDWKQLNSKLNISEEDQQELNNLLDSIDNSKIKFQKFDSIQNFSKQNDTEIHDYEHFKELSEIAKKSLKHMVQEDSVQSSSSPSSNTKSINNNKRKLLLSDHELLPTKKIKIKLQNSNVLLSQLKFSTINFASFHEDSIENMERLITEFGNFLTVLNMNDFENNEIWFKYIVSSNNNDNADSEIGYGINPSFMKSIEFFIGTLYRFFQDGKYSYTLDMWTNFSQLLDYLALNLLFDDESINNGRSVKLNTIKLIFEIYKFSLLKIEDTNLDKNNINKVKPFKFDVMESCLSIISEYSQDIFEKETGNSFDDTVNTFFVFFTLSELNLFYDCLRQLDIFLQMKPVLDSWNVNKIALSIQHIIALGNNVNKYLLINNNNSLLRTANLIRRTATSIFKEIFQRYPVQRDLILDLVISSFDKIPNTKQDKKLIEIKSLTDTRQLLTSNLDTDLLNGNSSIEEDACYISYFTYNLVILLQSLNINNEDDQNDTSTILASVDLLQKEWLSWSVLVTDSIFERLVDSLNLCKNSLDMYYKDLIKLLKLPEWNMSEYLLSSLTNKMIDVLSFDKKSKKIGNNQDNGDEEKEEQSDTESKEDDNAILTNVSTNTEGMALQVLSAVGSTMLDILSYSDIEDNNYSLKKLSEDSSCLKSLLIYLKSLRKLFTKKKRHDLSSYYKSKTICLLVDIKKNIELNELKNDSKDQIKLLKLIEEELASLVTNQNEIDHKDSTSLEVLNFQQFLQASTLMRFYEPYLQVILSVLGSKKAKLRTGALKNFSLLISKNKKIVNLPFVKKTIISMLKDSSAMVKDSILSILEQSPELSSYMNHININFNDNSLNVRSHVLAINQKIFNESLDISICSQSLHFIIRKLEDEDTKLEEEVAIYLYETLFVKLYLLQNDLSKQEVFCEKIVECLTDVVNSSERIYHIFQEFFNLTAIRQQSRYDKDKKNGKIDTSKLYFALNVITKKLIVKIVDSQQDEQYEEFSKYLTILGIIASCNSQDFINREDLIILYPFLNMNAETKNEKMVRVSILKIFNFCFKKERIGLRTKILGEMELFLLTNLTKFSINEIDIVVSILFNIARNRREFGNLSLTCKSLLTTFQPYMNKLNIRDSNNNHFQLNGETKLLKLIALLTSFAVYSKTRPKEFNISTNGSSLIMHVAKILILILKTQKKSQELLKTTLYQLGSLCNSNPALYNSGVVLGTIVQLLTDMHNISGLVKVQIVKTMTEYLREQELKPTEITEEITLGLLTKITPLVLPLMTINNNNEDEESISILRSMIEFVKMLQYVKFLNPQVYLSYCIPLIGSSNIDIRTSMIRFFINLDYDLNNTNTSNSSILEKGLKISLESFLDKKIENFMNINLNNFKIFFYLIDRKIFNVGKVLKIFMKFIREDSVLFSRNLRYDFKSSCFCCLNILLAVEYFDKDLIQEFIKLGQLNLDKYEDSLSKYSDHKYDENDLEIVYNGILSLNVYKLFVEFLEKKVENYDTLSFNITDFKWDSISFKGPIENKNFIIDKYFE